ncbi:MAG: SMI1/KNR4 family protein [Planctomycetaceae bacterium]|nr:SMI1/KNR4 family protein [Planctomycetaceae bacterium]
MFNVNEFWSAGTSDEPPATDADFQRLEAELGVQLPALLKELYRVQNGGMVEGADSVVFWPISPDGWCKVQRARDVWGFDEEDDSLFDEDFEDEYGDPNLLIGIGGDESGHTCLALNYNECISDGEPDLMWIDQECFDFTPLNCTFEEYVRDLTRVADAPSVTDPADLPLIAEEVITATYGDMATTLEQKVYSTDTELVIWSRNCGMEGEELSLCRVTKPISGSFSSIRSFRPGPHESFQILLQSDANDDEEDTIHWETSRKTSRGWKNGRSSGVPVYGYFESKDRAKLEELRREILGGEPPTSTIAGEQYQDRIEEMDEAALQAFAPQMMLEMFKLLQGQADVLGGMNDAPEEIKQSFAHLEQLKSQMIADLQQRADAAGPIPDDLLGLMQQMVDADVDDEEE